MKRPWPTGGCWAMGRGEIAEVTIGLMWLRKVLVATLKFWIHRVTVSFANKTWHCKAS